MESQAHDSSIDEIQQQFEPLYEQLKTTDDYSTDIIFDTIPSSPLKKVEIEETKSQKTCSTQVEERKSVAIVDQQ